MIMRMFGIAAMFFCLLSQTSFANEDALDSALQNARTSCAGISDEFDKLKTLAGINTAITGVGTLAGGGAVATGFVKQSRDAQIAKLEMAKLTKISYNNNSSYNASATDVKSAMNSYYEKHKNDTPEQIETEIDKLTKQSKNLGNWRTGLLAGSTATNIAGAIIAGNNRASSDLHGAVADCKSSVSALRGAYMQARLDGANTKKIEQAITIVSECGKWENTDISKIDNRATGAMWSSVAGATLGTAGTITSAFANTDKTRNDDSDNGKQKEKNLNTASNVLAIGTTAASLTATIFNATQIAAIKKASAVADECQEALQ
ncbi:MAG: hypothetical protein LBL75_01360 [Rickettsiales bacterium]|jgi:hypothetical protein|nr:hypothetical protein [Rickettsiales bacterium]